MVRLACGVLAGILACLALADTTAESVSSKVTPEIRAGTTARSTGTTKIGGPSKKSSSTRSSTRSSTTTTIATPTVILDYSTLVPAEGNATVGWYKFQNVRFAAAPTGSLRFAAPTWPPKDNTINNGSYAISNVDCKNAEDCLFCDVFVPARAFTTKKKFPVLQWYWGGGYYAGSKANYHPAGLFQVSKGFVYVACNHRLGFPGLANGPTFVHQGGASNAAVRDVEHAFKWTKKYISAFGGDPNQVTASGYSSGGSQVLWQMTRYAGRAEQLFHRAYLMSPGINPGAGNHQSELFWQSASTALGCDGGDLECMRNVSFANLTSTALSLVSQLAYQMQPRSDGDFLPDFYEPALYQGQYNWTGPTVITHNQHESATVPWGGVSTEADVINTIRIYFPGISDDAIQQILALYPAEDYSSQAFRFSYIYEGFHHTAHGLALTHALKNQTWNAYVQIPPSTHGSDLPLYFYFSNGTVTPTQGLARKMQKYLLSLVITGDPNKYWPKQKIYWPRYSSLEGGAQLVINNTLSQNETFRIVAGDDLDNAKTLFWNKGLWY
ncbi:Secreted lipase [Sphaceloma murrayae]|uniref:Secreted lipase n=1 Tax=Sphaceloma murrayae TaxID=2082308 RepID=A0A2K1QZ39_9PEZI|nr:Secreted lipase [Sphaceloma murrayae]